MNNSGMENRIKELRKKRGLSVRALAALLNRPYPTISELENSKTRLNTDMAVEIAKVLKVSPSEVAGWEIAEKGFAEDAEPYEGETTHLRLKETEFTYISKSNCLNQIGINTGDILIVDISSEAFGNLKTGNIVIAQAYQGMSATTILRQFVSPNILITNSSIENAPIINTDKDDVSIKGVVTSSMKRLRGDFPHFM